MMSLIIIWPVGTILNNCIRRATPRVTENITSRHTCWLSNSSPVTSAFSYDDGNDKRRRHPAQHAPSNEEVWRKIPDWRSADFE